MTRGHDKRQLSPGPSTSTRENKQPRTATDNVPRRCSISVSTQTSANLLTEIKNLEKEVQDVLNKGFLYLIIVLFWGMFFWFI